jgi:NAD(P)-dependent dehydrogenase (short-subunit alcohol dehydrogenase family)
MVSGYAGLLQRRIALVTGATRGLGRAIARTLAREGADVAFNYTRADAEASALVEEIRALGRRALPFKISVLDRAGVHELVKRVEADWGSIDVLVNNAGVGQVVPLALMEEEDWDRMMSVNVKGAVSANLPAPRLEEYLRNCALGRVGTFAEVAEVVAFVASDRNGYMNGATIVLDGAV